MACNNMEEANERIRVLEEQTKELLISHQALKKHYYEFVKATVQCFKETVEEE